MDSSGLVDRLSFGLKSTIIRIYRSNQVSVNIAI